MSVATDDVSRFLARWKDEEPELLAHWAVSPRPGLRVIRPTDLRWDEFIKRLSGSEGCDFHKREGDGEEVWLCDHTHRKAAAILATMPEIDVLASLNLFHLLNGCKCDCEIVFNMWLDDGE